MTFHWEFQKTPTDEVHHFSEGLVETTNQIMNPQITTIIDVYFGDDHNP